MKLLVRTLRPVRRRMFQNFPEARSTRPRSSAPLGRKTPAWAPQAPPPHWFPAQTDAEYPHLDPQAVDDPGDPFATSDTCPETQLERPKPAHRADPLPASSPVGTTASRLPCGRVPARDLLEPDASRRSQPTRTALGGLPSRPSGPHASASQRPRPAPDPLQPDTTARAPGCSPVPATGEPELLLAVAGLRPGAPELAVGVGFIQWCLAGERRRTARLARGQGRRLRHRRPSRLHPLPAEQYPSSDRFRRRVSQRLRRHRSPPTRPSEEGPRRGAGGSQSHPPTPIMARAAWPTNPRSRGLPAGPRPSPWPVNPTSGFPTQNRRWPGPTTADGHRQGTSPIAGCAEAPGRTPAPS